MMTEGHDQRFDSSYHPPMPEPLLDKPLSPRFIDALKYASELHRTQARKGTQIPYVAHLLGVASIALEHEATEDEAIAALLHDAVEDQGGPPRLAEIKEKFGVHVAAIVDGCSDTDKLPKPPWRERKEAYIAHIATASPSVRLVSIADKIHNARSIATDLYRHGEAVWDRFTAKKDESLWYYRALVNAFEKHGKSPLTEELGRVVTEMERVAGKG